MMPVQTLRQHILENNTKPDGGVRFYNRDRLFDSTSHLADFIEGIS